MEILKLVNIENRQCPYCLADCEIVSDGGPIAPPLISFNVDILTCLSCQEKFEIHWWGEDEPKIVNFVFSCKDICVFYNLENNYCLIGNEDLLWKSHKSMHGKQRITIFIPDFSNKEKLHNKLKVYLIFS